MANEIKKGSSSSHRQSHNKASQTAFVIGIIALSICVLLYFFPVWRLIHIGPMAMGNYYTKDEIRMALNIGSVSDRREARTVLHLAEKAFYDVKHTSAENEEAYGLLSRYATNSDSYGDVAYNEHSLKLWSAHLDEDEGWIWVFYSEESFYQDGSTACGSWRVPSLWKVKKNDDGEWTVVQIREHP